MNKAVPILIGMILVGIALWFQITSNKIVRQLVERMDLISYDLQLRLQISSEMTRPSGYIVIVDIDDKSLKEEEHWPWSRSKMAALTKKIAENHPAVIAFDMFFSEPERNIAEHFLEKLRAHETIPDQLLKLIERNKILFRSDAEFAKSFEDEQTVLGFSFLPSLEADNQLPEPLLILSKEQINQIGIYRGRGYISNIPVLQKAADASGFINIFPDIDGIIRHAPLIMAYKNGIYPSLSLQAVLVYLGEKIKLVMPFYNNKMEIESVIIGPTRFYVDRKGEVLIPFIGKSYSFPYFSATDVLHNRIPKEALTGKIVFIGTSATGVGDLKATAIQNPFPGVEIQASVANGLLLNNFSYKPAWVYGANFFIIGLLGLIAALSFPYFGPRILALLVFLLPILILFLNNIYWEQTKVVLSIFIPIMLVLSLAIFNIIFGYLFETRRREQLKQMFGQYVPEEHIDEMLKTKSSYALHGEDREMTVLFADIRGFTTISENMSAANLVDMLNTFFNPMTEIIFKYTGTIDKYVGDMIMAFWGAPLNDRLHARHALNCALAMRKKIIAMQPELKAHQWPKLKLGIGLNTGIMSVGDMGSRFRRNYTVLGDAVNLGSRVESLTKFYGVDIICTENTRKNEKSIIFQKLDRVRVKGKLSGIDLYEVVCKKSELNKAIKLELHLFEEALNHYFNREWEKAESLLKILSNDHPLKKIYKIYLHRITNFKMSSPPKDWDGVFVHKSK